MNEIEERIEELTDELSALCEENGIGLMCLCIKGVPTREAFHMGVLQGERFLADLNASAEQGEDDAHAYVDMGKIQSSAAFALGLLRAFTGSSIRAEETLTQMYVEDCLGEA